MLLWHADFPIGPQKGENTRSQYKRRRSAALIMSLTPRSLARFKGTGSRAMSSGSTQRVFQLKVDPLTGNSEWVVIDEQDQEEQMPEYPQKPLLATTSYLDMLNDSPRNTAFRQAIDKTVSKPCHVLDIGYVLPFSH
jgi:protein arginine N-methyltransferase 7